MSIDELIASLEEIRKLHGGRLPVVNCREAQIQSVKVWDPYVSMEPKTRKLMIKFGNEKSPKNV
jgi:hypothetical protein